MKILVIGKNGQMGQELILQAPGLGIEAVGTSSAECDVTQGDQVLSTIEKYTPDVIINTSAYNLVADAETHLEQAYALNAFAPFRLAKLCLEKNIRFVTVSTDYVFDGKKGTPYIEIDTPHPVQMYGVSKYAGELAVANVNPNALIIRTCGVYGGKQGSVSKKGNFILNILKQIGSTSELEVSSEQIVNPTFARHLAVATMQLLQQQSLGGVYHLANAGYCSWAECAQEIIRVSGGKMKIIPVDRSGQTQVVQRPIFSALENTLAKGLGVELPSWQQGVKEYIQSLKESGI